MDTTFLIPVLVLLLTTWGGGILVSNLTHGFSQTMIIGQCIMTLVVDVFSIIFCYYFFRDQKSKINFGNLKRWKIFYIILCIIIGMSMNLFSQWVLFCFPDLSKLSISHQYYQIILEVGDTWYYVIWAILLIPILEEIFYRGYIAEQCVRSNGIKIAIIGGSVIFSASHINIYMVLYTFVFGLLLNYIYIKTRCLYLTLLIHISNNLTRKVMPPTLIRYLIMPENQQNIYWFIVIVISGITAMVGSAVLVRKYINEK